MNKQAMLLISALLPLGLGAATLGFSCIAPRSVGADKPNFIVILTDDQGYQDLGCFGSPNIKTPNIDRMASQGMRFTDFYSAAATCTPSRAALLTGCYPERVGNLAVLFPEAGLDRRYRGLNPKETTIAEMLKAEGYATACIGKWHLGHRAEFLPTNQGFDSYLGIPYSNDMYPARSMKYAADCLWREGVTPQKLKEIFAGPEAMVWPFRPAEMKDKVPLMRDLECIEFPADQSTLTKRYTEEALKFITSNRDKPFFLYLPHTMPHTPLYASPEFEGRSDAGLYGDCVEEIDWSVGQIVKTLQAHDLDKNTLIVYTSDNGPWILGKATDKVKGNMNRRVGGSALPLRGSKFTRWEGGMRVPTVMWWPGRIPAGKVCTEIAGAIDLLPTLAELSGAKLPSEKIDGKSIVPLIEARQGAKSPHEAYFYLQSHGTSPTSGVRCGNWKLLGDELFNLADDISESKNVAAGNPEVTARLKKLLDEYRQELSENKRPPGMLDEQ
jgi:arylsulfatase A